MNANDFTDLHEQYSIFNIYKQNGYTSHACVKVICQIDASIITSTANKLMALQLAVSEVEKNNNYIIRCRAYRMQGVNRKVMEVSILVWIRATSNKPQGWTAAREVAEWLKAHYQHEPEINATDFDTSKLSVGPCSYADGLNKNIKYVKVRFDGVSIPVYFDSDKILLDRTSEILKPLNGPILAAKLIDTISSYTAIILERAKERPLNLSGIDEYARHEMSYWLKGSTLGDKTTYFHKISADSPYMSKPDSKVYPLCSYGYDWKAGMAHAYLLIDDVFYHVSGFRNRAYRQNQTTKFDLNSFVQHDYTELYAIYCGGDFAFFTSKELCEVPADDMFVRSKALRTLKAKI